MVTETNRTTSPQLSDGRPDSAEKRLFYWVAIPLIVLDQYTKWRVIESIPFNTSIVPIPSLDPYLRFTHVGNTGLAFSLFQNVGGLFTILVILVTIGLIYFNHSNPVSSRRLRVALGLIFSGAIGNLLDRLRIGHVTDFIDFDLSSVINVPFADWAVFNVADTAVVTGVIIMTYLTIFYPELTAPMEADGMDSAEINPYDPT